MIDPLHGMTRRGQGRKSPARKAGTTTGPFQALRHHAPVPLHVPSFTMTNRQGEAFPQGLGWLLSKAQTRHIVEGCVLPMRKRGDLVNTRLSLVRHGVTEWNYDGRVQGRSDIPLAPEGEHQAEAVAERLADESWDAIYSSPLKRAYETARAIARRTGHRQVITDARLVERNMGAAEGMTDADLPVLWPGVPWDDIPGMEPFERLTARAHDALIEMADRHTGGRVVCVAHGSLIRAFLRSLLPPGGDHILDTDQRTVSITTVHYDGKRFAQESAPDHHHILQDGIEYSGEKGRVSGADLESLLSGEQPTAAPLEPVIWRATAIESAWVDGKLVGFARAFTDAVRFGCIDIAVVLPGWEQVRPVLVDRLQRRFPGVQFTVLSS